MLARANETWQILKGGDMLCNWMINKRFPIIVYKRWNWWDSFWMSWSCHYLSAQGYMVLGRHFQGNPWSANWMRRKIMTTTRDGNNDKQNREFEYTTKFICAIIFPGDSKRFNFFPYNLILPQKFHDSLN